MDYTRHAREREGENMLYRDTAGEANTEKGKGSERDGRRKRATGCRDEEGGA